MNAVSQFSPFKDNTGSTGGAMRNTGSSGGFVFACFTHSGKDLARVRILFIFLALARM